MVEKLDTLPGCNLSKLVFASAQATVYDDLHMGDFIAVVVNFANQKTEHADGGVRLTCMHFALPYHIHVLKHGSPCRSYIHAHGWVASIPHHILMEMHCW